MYIYLLVPCHLVVVVLFYLATIDDNNIGYLNGTTLSSSEQMHMSSTLPLDLSL